MNNIDLTEKENLYYRLLKAQSGTLYLTSQPGTGKSSILKHMAEVLGWQYKDIRLAMIDPISVGQFPTLSEIDGIKVMDFAVPKWAVEANKQPTLIHFEELNRAPDDVRKAAMQLFLERAIGDKFKFNDNVYLVATGNLGKEDNTDVEEFDDALNNRLIHVNHNLTTEEWLNWGKNIIHPTILSYIEYEKGTPLFDNDLKCRLYAYASPRTWHMLSNYIITNYGLNSDVKDFINDIENVASFYIGRSSHNFIRYCNSLLTLSLDDILEMKKETKEKLEQYKKEDKIYIFMDLIHRLQTIDINNISDKQCKNITTFLKYCNPEWVSTYVNFALHEDNVGKLEKYKTIFKNKHKELKSVLCKVSENNLT